MEQMEQMEQIQKNPVFIGVFGVLICSAQAGLFGTNGTNGRYLFHSRAICSLFVPYLFHADGTN